MPAKPKPHYVAGFGAHQWTGQPGKGAGPLFIGAGFMTFIACLVLMIFIEPLRNVFVVIAVCTTVATIWTVADVVSKVKAEKSFLAGLTARVNGSILELTGDPNAQISAWRLQQLIQSNGKLPLQINGVPGLELSVVPGAANEATRVVAWITPPDYGLASFDLLLNAETQRKP
ncbi:hypothetical protein [Arthrobacter sp. NicSoilB8]|uniref:hypothetical protein n=1 Tax=Arthrobacter sp. NicSoilB8 TaxID=2830998 RepID=UPI001CC61EB3|nr:hypothetical protein [Arthrobacter sp. NicSoilB8]BCW71872.1 hypothetical protein NicSoilB8_29160 [Arthrobacter sp. NicSoilB8]